MVFRPLGVFPIQHQHQSMSPIVCSAGPKYRLFAGEVGTFARGTSLHILTAFSLPHVCITLLGCRSFWVGVRFNGRFSREVRIANFEACMLCSSNLSTKFLSHKGMQQLRTVLSSRSATTTVVVVLSSFARALSTRERSRHVYSTPNIYYVVSR